MRLNSSNHVLAVNADGTISLWQNPLESDIIESNTKMSSKSKGKRKPSSIISIKSNGTIMRINNATLIKLGGRDCVLVNYGKGLDIGFEVIVSFHI